MCPCLRLTLNESLQNCASFTQFDVDDETSSLHEQVRLPSLYLLALPGLLSDPRSPRAVVPHSPTIEDLAHFDSTAVPIFDLLLPRYLQLETLIVTATELSCRLFRLLPRSLRYLEITSLNDQARFFMDLQLLRDLEDMSLEVTLEELVVRDSAQVYSPDLIQEFYERCTARGIIFTFYPDSPDGSSTSDS